VFNDLKWNASKSFSLDNFSEIFLEIFPKIWISDTDDHQTPLLKRKQAGWQQANTDFIDLAQFMVKIPKMDKDGEKYKRPFLSECSDNDDMGFVAPLDFNSDSEIPRARDKERRESLNI